MASQRMTALDMLRGLAVAGMVLVDSPGSWTHCYAPLKHAEWNGWTAADLVFPTFLFSVGCALGLSFPRAFSTALERRMVIGRVARRTLALMALGLLLNALPLFDLAHLRLPGILQRTALCYALAVMLALATGERRAGGRLAISPVAIGMAVVAILIGYWVAMTFIPVPGFGAGRLDPEGNLAAYVDRAVFTVPHLWRYGLAANGRVTYDPEGLLSTLPATANVLFGLLAAWIWRRAPERAATIIGGTGVVLIVAGLLLDPAFPINKRIWTSSFALFSSGAAAVALGLLLAVGESRWLRRPLAPVAVLGGNAILAFVLSQLLGVFSALPILEMDGAPATPQHWGFVQASRVIREPNAASLLCAIAILTLIVLTITPLHRRAIHFRV